MRRLAPHLGHPLLTAALILTLYLDAAYWHSPRKSSYHTSLVGDAIFGVKEAAVRFFTQPARSSGPHASTRPYAVLIADETGTLYVRTAYPDDGGFRPYRDNLPDGHVYLAELFSFPRPRTVGLLAPVFTHRGHTLHILPPGAEPAAGASLDQLNEARRFYADFLADWLAARGEPTSPIPALLAQGDGTHTTLNPGPLLHDLLALPIILLAATSLLATPLWLTRKLRARLLPPHLCLNCRYDLTGLAPNTTCPECAHTPPPPPTAPTPKPPP